MAEVPTSILTGGNILFLRRKASGANRVFYDHFAITQVFLNCQMWQIRQICQ